MSYLDSSLWWLDIYAYRLYVLIYEIDYKGIYVILEWYIYVNNTYLCAS